MSRRTAALLLAGGAFAAPLDSLRFGGLLGLTDVLFLAALALLLVRALVLGQPLRLRPYRSAVLAAIALGTAGLFGTLFAVDAGGSISNLLRYATTTVGLPLAFALLDPSREEVRRIAWAFVLGATFSGLVSFTTILPVIGRATGLGSHPNVLGLSAAAALPILCGLLERASPRQRRLGVACGFALLVAVNRSGSRAGVLAALVGVVAYLVVTRRHRTVAWIALAGVVFVTLLVGGLYTPPENSALDRVLHPGASAQSSDDARATLASSVIDRITDNVFTGSGFARATEAHNVYLQVVDIGGVLGVAAFGALAASVVWSGFIGRREPLVAGALAMYLAYLASGIVVNALWDRWLWFPITIGLAARAATTRATPEREPIRTGA